MSQTMAQRKVGLAWRLNASVSSAFLAEIEALGPDFWVLPLETLLRYGGPVAWVRERWVRPGRFALWSTHLTQVVSGACSWEDVHRLATESFLQTTPPMWLEVGPEPVAGVPAPLRAVPLLFSGRDKQNVATVRRVELDQSPRADTEGEDVWLDWSGDPADLPRVTRWLNEMRAWPGACAPQGAEASHHAPIPPSAKKYSGALLRRLLQEIFPAFCRGFADETLRAWLKEYATEFPETEWEEHERLRGWAMFVRGLQRKGQVLAPWWELAAVEWARFSALMSPADPVHEAKGLAADAIKLNPTLETVRLRYDIEPWIADPSGEFARSAPLESLHVLAVARGRDPFSVRTLKLDWMHAALVDHVAEEGRVRQMDLLAAMPENASAESLWRQKLRDLLDGEIFLRGPEPSEASETAPSTCVVEGS